MHSTRQILKTMFIWAMIPITLVAGGAVPACACSNGQLKLFCPHALRGSCDADPSTSASCCSSSSQHDGAKKSCCCASTSKGSEETLKQGSCRCRLLDRAPVTAAERALVPLDMVVAWLPMLAIDTQFHSLAGLRTHRGVDLQAELPACDLVIAHCRFLI